ncbi:hypothetical protein FOA52_010296 [Chlamydomonas sp. UWO 241]|nr:hypothetical protein FOA52_010296 [Chlamydomonas sp. UWO 241]
MPVPVVEALLDLYRQVLLHVEANSKAEFADICEEHGVRKQLADIDAAHKAPSGGDGGAAACSAAEAAELAARMGAKLAEAALLTLELSRVSAERDALAAAKAARQAHIGQLAAGYKAAAGGMAAVCDASRGALDQQQA